LPVPDPSLGAEVFCRLIYEAPRRHLDGTCSSADKEGKTGKGFSYLSARASEPVAACVSALGPGVTDHRVQLPFRPAARCSAYLESLTWKVSLLHRDLSRHGACASLVVGKQPEQGKCRNSLECQPGHWCGGAVGGEGTCRKPAALGKPCEPSRGWTLGAPIVACQTGAYCASTGGSAEVPERDHRYAIGLPDHEVARRQALRDAAEFGMIGLLNTGGGSGRARGGAWHGLDRAFGLVASGEGIGLGHIGTIGHGGAPSGQGYGSSRARPHRSRPPRVRMGATSVSGRLPPEVVQRIVRQNFGRFRLCYEKGLERNPNLQGRVTVRFVIARDGRVSNVGGGGDIPDGEMVACVTRSFYGLSFPQPEGGIVTVSYPIVFTPGEPRESSPAPSASAAASASASAELPSEPPPAPRYECVAAKPKGAPCSAPSQCAPGLTCRGSECVDAKRLDVEGSCTADEDCLPGLFCAVDARCKKPKATGEPCVTASQCLGACGEDGKCFPWCGAG